VLPSTSSLKMEAEIPKNDGTAEFQCNDTQKCNGRKLIGKQENGVSSL
jgi:hypothetical protein